MPLPSSGPLSLNDIQTEFGGTNPIGLNEYYAGGGLVPAGTTGTNGAVPSSGAISIFNFYGTQAILPQWSTGAEPFGGGSSPVFMSEPKVIGNSVLYTWRRGTQALEMCVGSINNTTGAVNWSYAYTVSIPSSYSDSYNTAFTDNSGNTYLFFGRVVSGSAIFTKIDNTGAVLWTKFLGFAAAAWNNRWGSPIAVDSAGNIYLALVPYFSSNFQPSRLYKFDSNGNAVWVRYWANTAAGAPTGVYITSIAVDASDNVIAYAQNTGSSPYYGFLLKYNSSGTLLNSNRISSSAGDIYTFFSQDGFMTVAPSTGNIYITAKSPSAVGQGSVVYLIKLNSSFVVQWARYVNNSSGTNSLNIDPSENLYLSVSLPYSVGLAKINSSGSISWSQQLSQAPIPTTPYISLGTVKFFGASNGSGYVWTTQFYPFSPQYFVQFMRISATGLPPGVYPVTTNNKRGVYFGVNSAPSITNSSLISSTSYSTSATTESATSTSNTTLTSAALSSGTVTTTALTPSTTTGSYAYSYPGAYTWIVPTGVTSVSVVAIGGGGGGFYCTGAGGGALAYANNYTVTPGATINVNVGNAGLGTSCTYGCSNKGGASWFVNTTTLIARGAGNAPNSCQLWIGGTSGGTSRNGGGNGGNSTGAGSMGGSGAGGYSGNGGSGGFFNTSGICGSGGGGGGGGGATNAISGSTYYMYASGSGGGVAPFGQGGNGGGGLPGVTGCAGSCGYQLYFGGGGQSGGVTYYCVGTCCEYPVYGTGGAGGYGAVRIVWPGNTRTFPSTNTGAP